MRYGLTNKLVLNLPSTCINSIEQQLVVRDTPPIQSNVIVVEREREDRQVDKVDGRQVKRVQSALDAMFMKVKLHI